MTGLAKLSTFFILCDELKRNNYFSSMKSVILISFRARLIIPLIPLILLQYIGE